MRDCCIVVFPTDNKTGWIHDQIVGQPEQGLSQNIEHLPANYPKIHNLIPMNHSMGTMVEQPNRHATHDLYTYYIYTVPSHHGRFCIADEIDWPTHTACVKCNSASSKIVCQACIDFPTAHLLLPVSTEQEAHKLLLANILYMARFTAGWANSNYVYPKSLKLQTSWYPQQHDYPISKNVLTILHVICNSKPNAVLVKYLLRG